METRQTKTRKDNMSWTHSGNRRDSTDLPNKQQDLTVIILEELREFKKSFKAEIRDEQKSLREEIRLDLQTEIHGIGKKIDSLNKEFKEIKEEVYLNIRKTEELENKIEEIVKIQNKEERALWAQEKKQRDRAIKIRGLPETEGENLETKIIPALANFLDSPEDLINVQIDKLFRIFSKVAQEKGLPRDIAVSFNNSRIRERIIQKNFKEGLTIDNVEVEIYRDLPLSILKQRQQYRFLTALLQRKNISYRWGNIEGVVFMFKERRFKINSLEKAKEFYKRLLQSEEKEKGETRNSPSSETRETSTFGERRASLEGGSKVATETRSEDNLPTDKDLLLGTLEIE
ncbi:uncharacterized protein PF11_0207-like [Sceloporus undulatus]|uniref:uncharacterized protein PF11_0207-like n=1 Tax=Sceloporus undulatus TaxID=8520 RepID=UPI001C4D7323|nr:uncharacterized protein PF11_0207-like [Sceloporus undulatus]